MHKLKKETKGRIHDPILTHPECRHQGGGPNGGGWGGGFSFGWMDIGAKRKLGNWNWNLKGQGLSGRHRNITIL